MPSPIAVNITIAPQQLWSGRNSAVGSSLLLINNDITNTVLIGTAINNLVASIGPLGSISVDPAESWYAAGIANGTAPLIVLPGGTTWTPAPSQVAASISALGLATQATLAAVNTNVQGTTTALGTPAQSGDVTGLTTNGIPLLRGTSQLGTGSAQSLAAAATVTLLTTTITKPSFEAVFSINLPAAAGTVPFAVLGVGWQDNVTGLQVGYKQYVLTAGNGPTNALTFYLSGPCRGNKLVLTLQNLDPAQILTYSWLFNVISHIYTIDRFLQPAYPTTNPITFSTPGGNPAKGMLAMTQASISASSSISRLLACSNAKCKVLFDNSTANACNLILQDPATLYNGGTANQNVVRFNHAIGQSAVYEFQMPNGPLNMNIFNAGASGAVSPGVAITIMEY